MKIARIEPLPLALPLRKPMMMAGHRFETLETVLVRIETQGRHAGWGEASVAPFLTGETTAGIVAAMRFMGDALRGVDVRELGLVADIIGRAMVGNPSAKAALEMAAHDAAARALDVPLHRLLGGARTHEIGCLHLIGNGDPARDIAEAEARAAEGFRAIKYKVANGDLATEAETMVRLRRALGPDVLLCADANGGWSRGQAVRFVRLADASMADFIEQPVAADDHDGMARVAASGRIPVGADESLHGVGDIRRMIASGAASGGSFKIMKLGGIRACLDACRLASALSGEVNLSGKVGETSIANAATLAVAAAWGQPSWGLSLTNGYLAADTVRDPIALSGGRVRVRDGAGLGIEIDERMIERSALASAA
jgi:L-alanine-DL-glutamate epimerase-like enolase superfamily enzyme